MVEQAAAPRKMSPEIRAIIGTGVTLFVSMIASMIAIASLILTVAGWQRTDMRDLRQKVEAIEVGQSDMRERLRAVEVGQVSILDRLRAVEVSLVSILDRLRAVEVGQDLHPGPPDRGGVSHRVRGRRAGAGGRPHDRKPLTSRGLNAALRPFDTPPKADHTASLSIRGGRCVPCPATPSVEQFTVTTFGESHGIALGAIVDGCPPGMPLSEADLQPDLDRRRPGRSKYTSQRKETDRVEILSGVFEGNTTGTPIGLLIRNVDQKSKDYEDIKRKFRPAHADFTYLHKYGIRDYRGSGRALARETVMRVAAGAIAKKYLSSEAGVSVRGYLSRIGDIAPALESWEAVEQNPFFCPDPAAVDRIAALIDRLRREGDSIGAEVTVVASGVPVGLGEPVFAKLDSELAGALMGINAVKGVGIGDGFAVVGQRGTEHRDEMSQAGFLSNRAGGVLGASPPARTSSPASPSNPRPASPRPAGRSTSTATRPRWSPRAATTPAWAFAPRPSPKPWWRLC